MNIINLLDILTQESYSVEYDVLTESLIIKIPNLNCDIVISSPGSTGFIVRINSFNLIESTDTIDFEPLSSLSYFSSDFDLITPYLEPFIKEIQNHSNLLMASTEGLEEYNFILNIFKLILSEQALPEGYTYEFENNRNNDVILILTHDKDNRRHRLSFGGISNKISSIKTIMGILELLIYIEPLNSHPDYDLFIRPFKLMIPFFNISKYSMIETNKNLTHNTSLDNFIEQLTQSPNQSQHPLQKLLQHHLLSEKLSIKSDSNYEKKLKI